MGQLRAGNSDERVSDSPNEEFLLPEDERLQEGKPQEVTTRPRPSIYQKWVQDWWLLEIVSLLVGTISTIAIVIVLRHYQNQPAPNINIYRGYGVTLNTIVATLATISRVCLLYPVAECISQQKWAWFSGSSKPLIDLETFDKGGRGAFGSLMLLWRINLRQVASAGAILLLFGLAVDPLSQELVHYNLQPQADPSGSAYVSTALTWDTTSQEKDMFSWGANNDDALSQIPDPPIYMKAAIQNGLLNLGSAINDTQPFCASGNCTWPVYQSLAVCTRWEDVSTHLKHSEYHNEHYNITVGRWALNDRNYIETGLFDFCVLNMSTVAKPKPVIDNSNYVNALDFGDTIAFSDNPYPIADVFLLYQNSSESNDTDPAYRAIEFVLEWCVQEYNTSVVNGTTHTVKQSSTHNFTGGFGSLSGPAFNTMSHVGSDWNVPHYNVNNATNFIISNYLRKVLNGSVYLQGADLYKTSDAAESFYQRLNPNSPYEEVQDENSTLTSVTSVLQNIGTSMTNTVRRTDYTYSSMTGNQNLEYTLANGTAWRQQAFVRVQWAWFAAPGTLLMMSLMFCAITIVQSSVQASRYMIWKSSSISTLLALGEELHTRIGGLRSLSGNETSIKDVGASLGRNSDGEWRLQKFSNRQ